MGGDGKANANVIGRDVFGLTLYYFGNGDYVPITTSKKIFANPLTTGLNPLFNGNIAAMGVNISQFSDPYLYMYKYDQLNRLVNMKAASKALNTNNNVWNTPNNPLKNYKETISYDANGNILRYDRYNASAIMDSLTYSYYAGTNRLNNINDKVTAYTTDIRNQGVNNYRYDNIGNLTKDSTEGIDSIYWNVYGKITQINKHNGDVIKYTYDAAGNRISKDVNGKQDWYVRDASGNVLTIYTKGDNAINNGALTQTEVDLYGSSRLGVARPNINVQSITPPTQINLPGTNGQYAYVLNFTRGRKFFELSNHLGNVLVTISDKKTGISSNGTTVSYYNADVVSAQDYYPGGMTMPGRTFTASSSSNYRYGFNGKEMDNEPYGQGNEYDYGFRIYNPRIGRFLSVDPLTEKYPELTPYQFASNSPISGIDLDGLEYIMRVTPSGNEDPMVSLTKAADLTVGPIARYIKRSNTAASQTINAERFVTGKEPSLLRKAGYYFASYFRWNGGGDFTDADDISVLKDGKHASGEDATLTDKTLAGVGIFIPVLSGGTLRKAGSALIEGTIGVFKNGKEVREAAYKIGKYGYKGTKEYNSVLNAVKSGGNIVANSKDEALQFLKEAMPGIADETGKTASNFGYRIDNVVDEAKDGLKQGHQGLHINYYDKENKVKGTILIEETKSSK